MEKFTKFFAEDDGSLPTLNIRLPSGEAMHRLYSELRQNSDLSSPDDASFWDAIDGREVLVRDTPDPVAVVLAGRVDSWIFHGIVNVTLDGTRVPALGVGIDETNTLTLDYRMGEWEPHQVEALVRWLARVCDEIPGSSVALDEEVPREWTAEFARAFEEFRRGAARSR